MNWSIIELRDLEKVFNQVFNPEVLYGDYAEIYDEALTQSKHFGISWKQEMVDKELYFSFVTNYLENEGMNPQDFNSN